MPTARIYQRPKNAMQSGKYRTDLWQLDFERDQEQRPDPLTGWAGSGDTRQQVRLGFPSCEAAVVYCEKQGWDHVIVPAPERKLKLQAYADNFK